MNKFRRHEVKMLKYKKRMNKYPDKNDPLWKTYAYRSHGSPCSCEMCSPYKYRRSKEKQILLPVISEGVLDFEERYFD